MLKPIVGHTKVQKYAKKIVDFCETWWVNYFVRPLVFTGPPILLTAIVSRSTFSDQLGQIAGKETADFLSHWALAILLCAYLYVVIVQAIYAGIENLSKPDRELTLDDLLSISQSIKIVVEDKCRRFENAVKAGSKQTSLNPSETFVNITRPDQQLVLLVNGIQTVFEYIIGKDTSFRVGLIRVINSKPVEWVAYAPRANPPRTAATALSAASSTVSKSIHKKSIIVVEDIQKELKKKPKKNPRFIQGNTQDTDQGSQLCYPIFSGSAGTIEYVLSVSGNKKDCLLESHAPLYTWILDNFVLRIILEHNLLILKDKSV